METNNNKINLSELLKGAPEKGVTFYSPWFGQMRVKSVADDNIKCYAVDDERKRTVVFDNEGYMKQVYSSAIDMIQRSAEPMLFPDKEQRTWDGYSLDVYPNLPSSWDDLRKSETGERMKTEGKIPYAEEMKTLQMLLILRDEYRKADSSQIMKFNVRTHKVSDKVYVSPVYNEQVALISFQNEFLADRFVKCFGDMLESIKKIL